MHIHTVSFLHYAKCVIYRTIYSIVLLFKYHFKVLFYVFIVSFQTVQSDSKDHCSLYV